MRKLLRLLLCAVALTGSLLTFAQNQPISGTVKDPKDNAPLVAATIVNKRTKKTALTNEEGKFSIAAQPGDELAISHIGRKTFLLKVGAEGAYNVMLEVETSDIGEAVVTAMDIKRNPRELGYSIRSSRGEPSSRNGIMSA
jgi:hypothetical protein